MSDAETYTPQDYTEYSDFDLASAAQTQQEGVDRLDVSVAAAAEKLDGLKRARHIRRTELHAVEVEQWRRTNTTQETP